jgi:tRNA1Val (adenine37-N6)-methyltransferase
VSAAADLTIDGFLNRRLTVCQKRRGFRAGHDSVLLAASVPAGPEDRILELGSGAGVVSLCLAARVTGCRIAGIEIDPELVAIANENAERNGFAERVRFVNGDVLEHDFGETRFHHVFLNPPFHPDTGRPSLDKGRALAMHDDGAALSGWTRRALDLVRPQGTVTVILRADRLEAWSEEISCGVTVLPLAPHEGEESKRIIARLDPDAPAALKRLEPFVLHTREGKPTEAAEAVLRHMAPLSIA